MSDDGMPSQFVDEAQNEENFNDLLDFELFGDDDFSVDVDGEQGPDVPDESINQQDVASSATAGTREQQQGAPSNVDVQPVQPPLNDEDFLESQDFVQEPENGATSNEALGGAPSQTGLPDLEHHSQSEQRDVSSLAITNGQHSLPRNSRQELDIPNGSQDNQAEAYDLTQSQPGLTALQNIDLSRYLINVDRSQGGLMSGDHQAHPRSAELGAADPSSRGLPTNGLTNLDQNPGFNLDFFNAEMWQNYGNIGADVGIDEILGGGVPEGQQSQVHEQESHNYRQGNVGQSVGTSSNHVEPLTASRQRPPANTPGADSVYDPAARSRGSTHSVTPAIPHQANNAVQRPEPSSAHRAPSATTTAVRHPPADNHADSDDEYFNESDEESEGSSVSDHPDFETYAENDPLIVPDPPRQNWGRTGRRNGQEVWFNPEIKLWQPSASHHDMRATLIARAQAEYPNDRYLHPDPTDGIPHGETAFFKPHQNRGPARSQCADELFIWRDYQPKKDENGKPLRRVQPKSVRHPGFMWVGGRILLDPRNNPVVNHKFIPLTLAVHTDGGKLQEMALKPGCRQVDLWARMPRYEKEDDKSNNSAMVPLRSKNTRINMPMTRFREKKGTIAGSDREGTDSIMDGLRRFYHHHGFDIVAAGNSVKTFPRDLEPWEVKEVRLGNISQFGRRAGRRALDLEAREANMRKTLKSIENGKRRQAANGGDGARKRSREDDGADFQGSSVGRPKRHRGDQEVDPGLAAFDEGYTGQQAASTFSHGQNGYGFQPNPVQQQGGYAQATRPSQVRYSDYGPQTFPAPPAPRSIPYGGVGGPQVRYSDYGPQTFPAPPAPRSRQQPSYGGVDLQATRSPHVNAQAPAPLDNSLLNSRYYPEDQYPRFDTGAQNFGSGQTQQTSRFAMGQSPRIPAAVQRQRHVESPYRVPTPAGNTLAPGGRGVLGKRRRQDTQRFGTEDAGTTNAEWGVPAAPNSGSVNLNIPNGSGQQHHNNQTHSDPHLDPARKRQRQNPPPATQPMQQRQGHHPHMPRPSRYGAVGAPTPLTPLDPIFGGVQPGSTSLGNADGLLQSPATIARELDDLFRDSNPTPTPNVHVDQGTIAPRRQEPRQVLGKHRREDPMGQWGDDFDDLGQDIDVPEPKRHRMAEREGYNAPQVQAPPARPVRQARNREGDAQRRRLQLNTNEPIPNTQQTPQVLGVNHLPPQNIYNSNPSASVGGPTQGFDPLGSLPPQHPVLPQLYPLAPADIREIPPSNGDESQSLDSALRYTREAFREWTGQEPPVTNLEHSYNQQWREIRAAFRAWWRSEGNAIHGQPMPELWRARQWSGTMDDWDAPEDEEHLREARGRGGKAA